MAREAPLEPEIVCVVVDGGLLLAPAEQVDAPVLVETSHAMEGFDEAVQVLAPVESPNAQLLVKISLHWV